MQAYIKCKAYYDKKANVSKPKECDYFYVVQTEADYQGSEFFSQSFVGLGPTVLKKPNQKNITWYARTACGTYTRQPAFKSRTYGCKYGIKLGTIL